MQEKIAFIGAGNMANSLIGGLINNGYPSNLIFASDPSSEKLAAFRERYGIHVSEQNHTIATQADIIILAVKPMILKSVAKELAPHLHHSKSLIISIAAGVHTQYISQCLGEKLAIIRCMPNTPALLQAGATALFATPQVSKAQRDLAESIMRCVGITVWLNNEKDMDIVTALSGSGPAYFFFIMEALEQAAIEQGLSKEIVHLLTIQTALGASRMALESNEPIVTLRKQVTSPGGTTERALHVFELANLRSILKDALTAAKERSIELANILET